MYRLQAVGTARSGGARHRRRRRPSGPEQPGAGRAGPAADPRRPLRPWNSCAPRCRRPADRARECGGPRFRGGAAPECGGPDHRHERGDRLSARRRRAACRGPRQATLGAERRTARDRAAHAGRSGGHRGESALRGRRSRVDGALPLRRELASGRGRFGGRPHQGPSPPAGGCIRPCRGRFAARFRGCTSATRSTASRSAIRDSSRDSAATQWPPA